MRHGSDKEHTPPDRRALELDSPPGSVTLSPSVHFFPLRRYTTDIRPARLQTYAYRLNPANISIRIFDET